MRLSQMEQACEIAWEQDIPLLVWGPPGIGKTSKWQQFAQKKFHEQWEKHYFDWRLTELESVDMRGTPRERNGYTYWAPPEELPIIGNNKFPEEGILNLEELAQAKTDVKNVASRLVLERRIGEARLKPGWRIGASSNRMGDAAGTSPMPTHLNNRFWHIDIEVDIEEWVKNFAEPRGLDARVIGYLKYCAAALLDFDPRSKEAAFASPRTWAQVSKMLAGFNGLEMKLPPALLGEFISGHVGRARGGEMAAFLRTTTTLVSIEQILLNPERAPLATEPSLCYVLSASLAATVTRKTIGAAFTYLGRLSQEFQFVFANRIKQRDEKQKTELQQTRPFVEFAEKNAGKL